MAIAVDELGIMTESKKRRETYGYFIRRRLAATIDTPAVQGLITKMVDERLKYEIDQIVARRTAETLKEMEAAGQITPKGPPVASILAAVAEATGRTVAELSGIQRSRPIAHSRQFGYFMVRALRPDLSLMAIGRIFNRDHSTVMYGLSAFEKMRETAPAKDWLEHPAIKALTP